MTPKRKKVPIPTHLGLGTRARVSRRWVGLVLEMLVEKHHPGSFGACRVPAQLDKLCLASAAVPGFVSAVMLCSGVLSLSLLSPLMARPASHHLCCPKPWLLPPPVASPQQVTPWSLFEEPLQIC